MESSEEDVGEDDSEWKSSFTDPTAAASGTSFSKIPAPAAPPQRVILHFDLDCFYAQVEMIRNPDLRTVPLGIQQKYIVVTCNYMARDHGVTKLMSVTDAQEKCPQLVLVKGEDLTHYREMSYKVTELLMSYCPLVERLGFDENFMEVTEMVERRLMQTPESNNCSFKGHVYDHLSADAEADDHRRLALGSHIAAELREAVCSKLGLTGCAGIATNKLLAKLVSGTFKPNQQTTLLPENVSDIMGRLTGLRKVPGVGHQTSKRLQALGLVSVQDLQLFPLADLEREFGGSSAQRLKNLALGIDDSPVTPTGAPQSLSDEDSFKKMSSTKDVLQKIEELLGSLVERMHTDGRQPQTFRLTIRRYSAANKWFSRESRQCPVPGHIGQKIISGGGDPLVQLVTMAMKLFHKMVGSSAAFHLTLINVCFTKLRSRAAAAGGGKGSIASFFTHGTKTQSSSQNQDDSSEIGTSDFKDHRFGFDTEHRSTEAAPQPQKTACNTAGSEPDETNNAPKSMRRLPPDVDPEVFRLLPEEIQKELLSPAYANSLPDPPTPTAGQSDANNPPQQHPHASEATAHSFTDSLKDRKEVVCDLDSSDKTTPVSHQWPPGPSMAPEDGRPTSRLPPPPPSPDCQFPADVDPKVFSELPLDVQRELRSEWKQQRPVLKKTAFSRKQGRNSGSKEKKAAAKGGQANNLLKYFKPS